MTLHSEQDAIKQAVEAGWKPKDWTFPTITFDGVSNDDTEVMFSNEKGEDCIWREYPVEVVFSDPAFWQALGKARHWEHCRSCDGTGYTGSEHNPLECTACGHSGIRAWWKSAALRYFETVLSGGDIKAFWQDLP